MYDQAALDRIRARHQDDLEVSAVVAEVEWRRAAMDGVGATDQAQEEDEAMCGEMCQCYECGERGYHP
jgi:hypothetical protein